MSDTTFLPFILAYTANDSDVAAVSSQVESKIIDAGFVVAGIAKPFDDAAIICITNDELKEKAASKPLGCFAVCQRVSITKNGDRIEVTWTNPKYMGAVCRIQEDYSGIYDQLAACLGNEEEFGAKKALTDAKLRKYHYKLGMPYFNEPWKLASYSSHEEACDVLSSNLASNSLGLVKVYQVTVTGKEETTFGVTVTEGQFTDEHIMKKIDTTTPRHTAHLPVEIAVVGKDIIAHSPKFRIAISFTDLKMVGNNSFASIMECPSFFEKIFKKIAKK